MRQRAACVQSAIFGGSFQALFVKVRSVPNRHSIAKARHTPVHSATAAVALPCGACDACDAGDSSSPLLRSGTPGRHLALA